jgi:organic radical activating enzyme
MNHVIRIEHQDPAMSRIALVDWCFGNICNYACSYCPDTLHDGSIGWQDYHAIVRFCSRLISHYANVGKSLFFQFSGGEPTLYPKFLELSSYLHDRSCKVGIISNASRKIEWWERASGLLDNVVLTHHIEFVDIDHFIRVVQSLSRKVRTHVNVTMHPDQFDTCLANAMHIADVCADISLTLKPLLLDFGSTMYSYSEGQKDILRNMQFDIMYTRSLEGPRGAMRRIYSDGKSDTAKASQMIVSNENRWAGWSCEIGLELLAINYAGEIYRGVCKQGGKIGVIADDHTELPDRPIICQKAVCHCVTDIMTTRTLL